MFRRISGSSSMTNIFFMIFLKSGKPHRHGRACAEFAFNLHLPAVQIGTAFHEQQAEPSAGSRSYVAAAMKGFEQLLLIFLWNANPLVTNHAHRFRRLAFNNEMHGRSSL